MFPPVVPQPWVGWLTAAKRLQTLMSSDPRSVWLTLGANALLQVGDIPADMADQAAEYREKLVESAVELDDDAMMMYLEVSCMSKGNRCGRSIILASIFNNKQLADSNLLSRPTALS